MTRAEAVLHDFRCNVGFNGQRVTLLLVGVGLVTVDALATSSGDIDDAPPHLQEAVIQGEATWMTVTVAAEDLPRLPTRDGDELETSDGVAWDVRGWSPVLYPPVLLRLYCSTEARGGGHD